MLLWKDRRLRLTLTRLGVEYVVILLLLGLFAANTGNNLLYVIFSLMLGLFLVSGWVSRHAIRDIQLQGIEEGNLFARVRGGLRLRLADDAPKRIRGLEVHVELEQGRVEPGFYPGGDAEMKDAVVVLHVQAEHRGWNRVKGVEFRTRYPFGLLEKAWRFSTEKEILVLPHPRSVNLLKEMKGDRLRPVSRSGNASPDGARPYRVGDSLSRMHWKRTAQRGLPWIRTMEDEDMQGLRLRLDLRNWSPGLEFEKELERLSGSVLQARLQKRDVFLDLVDRSGTEEFSGHTECWRALALAQAEDAALR